jgi:hypothetical protein|tara:strand:- start:912 stop:1448 length:537 start_codon:yes stop_codon:yes gene_type:complete
MAGRGGEVMSLLRHDARRDANEPEIVEALEKVGCLVMRLGLIDLLVCLRGELFLLEVKTLRGTRTKTQAKLLAEGWPISTVTNISEALAAISTQSRSFRRCKTCDHTFEVGQGGYSENREFCSRAYCRLKHMRGRKKKVLELASLASPPPVCDIAAQTKTKVTTVEAWMKSAIPFGHS